MPHQTVVLTDAVSLGGADRVTLNWATTIQALGSEVQVFHAQEPGLLTPVFKERGIGISRQDHAGVVQNIVARRPDTVVCNIATAFTPLLPAIRPFTRRLVCLIHSMTPWSHQFLTPALVPLYDHIVVITAQQVDEIIAFGIPTSKVVCIKNFIDTEEFHFQEVPRSPEFRIGYAGRADGSKRTALLPEVLALLRIQGVKAHLVLLGMVDGGQGASTKFWEANTQHFRERTQWLNQAPFIEYLPPTPHPAGFYASLDALILLSVSEGSPLVVWEALACGTPVVTTDVGDVRRICLPETGSLVLPNIDDCVPLAARALRVVASRPQEVRETDRKAAATLVHQLRGVKTWNQVYLPVLRHVLGGLG